MIPTPSCLEFQACSRRRLDEKMRLGDILQGMSLMPYLSSGGNQFIHM